MTTLRIFQLFLLLIFSTWNSFAAEITGTVSDYSNGKGIEGTTVRIESLQKESQSDWNGGYKLKDIPLGKFVVTFSHPRYHTYSLEESVISLSDVVKQDVSLKLLVPGETTAEYQSKEPRYQLDEVTVLTTRASRDHPVTFTNLNKKEAEERNYGQDLPLLFTELPNLNAYSDGGNGIGYSYLRMRGFSQNRIAVQLNGTPLNDAESHEVFWVDLPDFAKDVQDIQVQRGVGSSLYGAAAMGGSINLMTRSPGLGDLPRIRTEATYGSWDTRRAMVDLESGRIQNRYGIRARLTREKSNGYRDNSWSDLWSYNLTGAFYGKQHTTQLNLYGGPERVHLAYDGIPDSLLRTNRRYNPLTYSGEIDNFFQPHYELLDNWKVSDRIAILNTLYLFRGDGYYDQYRPGSNFQTYYFETIDSVNSVDILRRRNIGETDWGWIPRVSWDHPFGNTTIGGEARLHKAHHEGFVVWSSYAPAGLGPNYKYYDYKVEKQSYSGYIHNLFAVNKDLRIMADLQTQSHHYEMNDDRMWGVSFSKTYSSINPRLGVNYALVDGVNKHNLPALSVYGNLSFAQREPAVSDIYDAQDYYSIPFSAPNRFSGTTGNLTYIGPSLKPEKLTNWETGVNAQWTNARCGLNYYYITVHDEIVPYAGQLDDNGVPVSGNADKTLHQGVELVAIYSPVTELTVSGNLAVTDHHFVHYSEYVWEGDSPVAVSRNGNRLPADPPYLANLRVELSKSGFTAAISYRAIGKQYIDNSANKTSQVSAYQLVGLDLGYRFSRPTRDLNAIDLSMHVNNILDKKFVAFGYADYDDGSPRYIVGAPRAVYTTLAVEL